MNAKGWLAMFVFIASVRDASADEIRCNSPRDRAGAMVLAELRWPKDVSYVELREGSERFASVGARCTARSTHAACDARYANVPASSGRALLVERGGKFTLVAQRDLARIVGKIDTPSKAVMVAALAGYDISGCKSAAALAQREGARFRLMGSERTLFVDASGVVTER